MSTDTSPRRDENEAQFGLYVLAVAIGLLSAALFLMYL
jgi:hypothetical protein